MSSLESLFDDIEELNCGEPSPISGLVETRGNYKRGTRPLSIVSAIDRKRLCV